MAKTTLLSEICTIVPLFGTYSPPTRAGLIVPPAVVTRALPVYTTPLPGNPKVSVSV